MLGQLQDSLNSINQGYRRVGEIDSLSDIFGIFINTLIGITFAISVLGMAYAFFQYVMSRGDKDAVKKAGNSLTWSVIAMLISLFVVVLRTILYKLLGFSPEYEDIVPGY